MADFEGRDGNSLLNKSQAVLGGRVTAQRYASLLEHLRLLKRAAPCGSRCATVRCAALLVRLLVGERLRRIAK